MKPEFKVFISNKPWISGIELTFVQYGSQGEIYAAKPLSLDFAQVSDTAPVDPTLRLGRFQAEELLQAFADCLEENRIRPRSKPPLENELTAVRYHLEDMRKLALKGLVK